MKALLFDLGNVLVSFDHRRAAGALSVRTSLSPEEIYSLFFDSALTGLFEEGKITPERFYRQVREQLAADIDYADFVRIWNDIFFMTDENRALYGLISALRSRHTLALVSNINVLHFEYLRRQFPVFEPFHHLFLSYELMARKPAESLYRAVLTKLGYGAGECFYTDDREDLIMAARGLGIRAFLYRGVNQLKQDLRSEGIEAG